MDCINQINIDEIKLKFGETSALISFLKILLCNPENAPVQFNWTEKNAEYAPSSKNAIFYFCIIRVLLSKLLLKPVESNLVSRYNATLAKNIKTVASCLYTITYSICKPSDLMAPSLTCKEFEISVSMSVKGEENVTLFDKSFLKLVRQFQGTFEDSKEKLDVWCNVLIEDLE